MRGVAVFVIALLAGGGRILSAQSSGMPAMPVSRVWDLTRLYATDAAWEGDLAAGRRQTAAITGLAGNARKGRVELIRVMDSVASLRRRVAKLASYADMRSSLDSRDTAAARRVGLAQSLESSAEEAIAPIEREIFGIGAARAKQWLSGDARLENHRRRLHVILRDSSKHVSARVAAAQAELLQGRRLSARMHSQMVTARRTWPTIYEGTTPVVVNPATYGRLAASLRRNVRFHAGDQFYAALDPQEQPLATALSQRIRLEDAAAELLGFGDGATAFLHGDGFPPHTSDSMVASARRQRSLLQKYLKVRWRALGLPVHTYADLRMSPALSPRIPVEAARTNLIAAVEPLGAKYQAALASLLQQPVWHLETSERKRAAPGFFYSTAGGGEAYGIMQYRDDLASSSAYAANSVALLSWSSAPRDPGPDTRVDPPVYANVVTEAGRMLHDDHLVTQARDPLERMALLVRAGDELRLRYYRAALNAEFEQRVRRLFHVGNTDGSVVSKTYLDLLTDYYGDSMDIEPFYSREWMNNAALFSSYATQGFPLAVAAAALLVERAYAGDTTVHRAFDSVLGRGDSDLSHDLLKAGGVDLGTSASYAAVGRRLERITSELEKLLAEHTPPSTLIRPDTAPEWSGRDSAGMRFHVDIVATGLRVPSAIAFVRDTILVAERGSGRLVAITRPGAAATPIEDSPAALVNENGGMLDVVLHPNFNRNRLVYYAYSSGSAENSTTVVERARLEGLRLAGREQIFSARPEVASENHYGARIALKDGYIFISLGERDQRAFAQDMAAHHGKIVRLHDDGRIPADNPFVNRRDTLPEIWSSGHRNPQGLAFHPVTGALWSTEHGPRGGDEVNVVERGSNYGWPRASAGREYTGEILGEGLEHVPGTERPVYLYTPSIAPSGLLIYSGSAFEPWRGNVFTAALAFRHLNMLVMRDGRIVREERLLAPRNWRLRDVRQGPDGFIYVTADHGIIARLRPEVTASR